VFLFYLNRGERDFCSDPIRPHAREAWAFHFTIAGKARMVVKGADGLREIPLVGPMLTITGPKCVHGYQGEPGEHCKVVIFHFNEVDYAIRAVINSGDYRNIRFPESDIPRIDALYERSLEGSKDYGVSLSPRNKTLISSVIHGIIGLELALFFLRRLPQDELGPTPNYGEAKVAEALAWYEANLSQGRNIQDAARAVHISATHLRRLFHKVRGISPQQALTELQIERAKWLLRDLSVPIENIAESVGFGSASAFSRAFKAQIGVSPQNYRKSLKTASAGRRMA